MALKRETFVTFANPRDIRHFCNPRDIPRFCVGGGCMLVVVIAGGAVSGGRCWFSGGSGCLICSTSDSDGNQVDGLPPSSSLTALWREGGLLQGFLF